MDKLLAELLKRTSAYQTLGNDFSFLTDLIGSDGEEEKRAIKLSEKYPEGLGTVFSKEFRNFCGFCEERDKS